jgi:hypothetical protein
MLLPPPAFVDNLDRLSEMTDELHRLEHRRNNPVLDICDAIRDYVVKFESELDSNHEVGVRLASFGGVLLFHVEQIGFSKPNIITFYGTTPEGERVQLVQHSSQLSFLLKAVEKREEQPKRIGFV